MTALIAIVAALFGGLLWAGRRRRLAAYSYYNQAVYDADTVCDDNSCDSYDDADGFCSDDDRDDPGYSASDYSSGSSRSDDRGD